MNKVIKGLKEGLWEQYFSDGSLYYRGSYLHDKMVGYWVVNYLVRFKHRKQETEFYL